MSFVLWCGQGEDETYLSGAANLCFLRLAIRCGRSCLVQVYKKGLHFSEMQTHNFVLMSCGEETGASWSLGLATAR